MDDDSLEIHVNSDEETDDETDDETIQNFTKLYELKAKDVHRLNQRGGWQKLMKVLSTLTCDIKLTKGRMKLQISTDTESKLNSVDMKVSSMLNWSRFAAKFTHFISVPMTDTCIRRKFVDFKERVLSECETDISLIDPSLFQKESKLHMTFGVMYLNSPGDEEKARQLLMECREKIVKPLVNTEPVTVTLKGLDTMKVNKSRCSVLYMKPHNCDQLQIIADGIAARFQEENLMKQNKGKGHVLLHVTLMNSTFRMRNERKANRKDEDTAVRSRKRLSTFDATEVIEKFGDFEFSSRCDVNEIHISLPNKFSDNGYYLPMFKIDLN